MKTRSSCKDSQPITPFVSAVAVRNGHGLAVPLKETNLDVMTLARSDQ